MPTFSKPSQIATAVTAAALQLLAGCDINQPTGPDEGAAADGGAESPQGGGGGQGDPDTGGGGGGGASGGGGVEPTGPTVYATRPSKGSAIATNEAGTLLAVANRATDDVTLFKRKELKELARIKVGDEPVSVTFSPDGDALYVVNRADATVSMIVDLSGKPYEKAVVKVGAEPGLAALSPSGRTLYVSSWVDGTLQLVDTRTAKVRSTLELGGAPFAVCVTNDGDEDDEDEQVFVTDFYSRSLAGKREATDGSRQGRVFRVSAKNPDEVAGVTYLDPLAVQGIEEAIDAANTQAFPNQLFSCVVHQDHLYVTAVGASPEAFNGTTDFRQNVHGLLYAIELGKYEVDPARTVNLSELVAALEGEKRFAAVPNDIEFVPDTDFAYLTVQSADMVLRVDFSEDEPIAGSPSGANFLPTDKSPSGLTIFDGIAYSYNEVGRSVSEIDLPSQTTLRTAVESAPQPDPGTEEAQALLGQRFFNTGLARWSTGAWVSCASCHPGGMTDNVTWSFPAGPRQTVDTSATFNADGSIQRILNWTAIFDEIHDFELNTRGVANGVGAIVSDAELAVENRIDFVGPGGVGDPENGFNIGSVKGINDRDGVLADWDDIELFVKTLRTPRGATLLHGDPEAGRKIFNEARCQNCHGGELWTLSERYFEPVLDGDLRRVSFAEAGITELGEVRADQTVLDDLGFGSTLLENDANGAPQRHACVVRDVKTFGSEGPAKRGAEELRQNGAPAQGVDGFNVPSLLGVGMGAPFLHHGAVETLEELLDPKGQFGRHLQAGNQVFAPSKEELADLVAFVRTIDESTPTFELPKGQQLCPSDVAVPPRVPPAEEAPAEAPEQAPGMESPIEY